MKLVINKTNNQHNLDKSEQEKIDAKVQEELNKLSQLITEICEKNMVNIPDCTNEDMLNVLTYTASVWALKAFLDINDTTEISPSASIWSAMRMFNFHVNSTFSNAIGFDPLQDI
jgi:hypothetical protein